MRCSSAFKKILLLSLSLGIAGFPCSVLGVEAARSHTAFVRVDGMVCYYCSAAIKKQCKLTKLGTGYATDLKQGLFEVNIAPEEQIPSPRTIAGIVRDAGFTYRGVRIDLEGRLVGKPAENAYGFFVKEKRQLIVVKPANASITSLMASSLNQPVRVTLEAKETDGNSWRITGLRVQPS